MKRIAFLTFYLFACGLLGACAPRKADIEVARVVPEAVNTGE